MGLNPDVCLQTYGGLGVIVDSGSRPSRSPGWELALQIDDDVT